MTNQLSIVPDALQVLRGRLQSASGPDDLLQPLQVLQRMGLSKTDLTVHVERMRAANSATSGDEDVEDNALLALDLIEGRLALAGLRWDPSELARIWLPRAISQPALNAAVSHALLSNDLLPPRLSVANDEALEQNFIEVESQRLAHFEAAPTAADFFRVPKTMFVSRPAALLAAEDRLLYEALASTISPGIESSLRDAVVWPRSRADGDYAVFEEAPRAWEFTYVVRTDIENFYECIDHSILAVLLESRVRSGSSYAKALESFLDTVMDSRLGLPQGPVGSDIFATAYLMPADDFLARSGWTFVRYADDYLFGANSVVGARKMIEMLEATLRPLGLRLNPEKTKIIGAEKYIEGLDVPARRIQDFRGRLQTLAAESLGDLVSDELQAALISVGVDEQILWDLLYHETTSLDEVVADIDVEMLPVLGSTYARLFSEYAASLDGDDRPSDMATLEKNLRDCLIYLSATKQLVDLSLIDRALRWFPRLAEPVVTYLDSVAPDETALVRQFIESWISPSGDEGTDTDVLTAWMCHAVERAPVLADDRLTSVLVDLASDATQGLLTRFVSVRALASAGRLSRDLWSGVFRAATLPIRSEMVLAGRASPETYPWLASLGFSEVPELGP